jgi:cell division protein FtsN
MEMKTKHFTSIVIAGGIFFLVSLFFGGCSSSDESQGETEEEITQGEQPAPKVGVYKPGVGRDTVFITKKDTVVIRVIQQPKTELTEGEPAEISVPEGALFTVQIGAFRNPANGDQAYRKAMQEFTESVYKDYNASSDFHRVMVGNFQTKTEALAFRQTCVEKGYADAWVLPIKRTVPK